MTLWNEGPVQAVVKQLIGGPVRQLHHAKGIYFQFPTREVDTVGDKAAGTLMPSRKVRTRGLHRDTQPFQICSAVYLDDVPSGGGGFTCLPGSHAELYPTFEHEYHYEPIQPLHDETMKRLIKTIEPHEVTGGRGKLPRYRCHLRCILLKMPVISLPTGPYIGYVQQCPHTSVGQPVCAFKGEGSTVRPNALSRSYLQQFRLQSR